MGVPGKCLDADVNSWMRHNEKDKKTLCIVLACVVALLDYLRGRRSLSSSFGNERRLILLPQWHDNGFWHSRSRGWNLFATTWQFLKLGKLLRRRWWNLLSSNVGWWYSRGASTWSLHPYSNVTGFALFDVLHTACQCEHAYKMHFCTFSCLQVSNFYSISFYSCCEWLNFRISVCVCTIEGSN